MTISINLFRLSKFNYVKKEFILSTEYLNISHIKTHTFQHYSDFISNTDISFWIYAGKLINDQTDLTTITHPICVYILTDVINRNESTSLFNLFNTIMNSYNIEDLHNNMYDDEIQTMLNMGFIDEERIGRALLLAAGDISYAIDIYSRV